MTASFEQSIANAINCHNMENGSSTPDFILATYLKQCLYAFNQAVRARDKWYGKDDGEAKSPPVTKARPTIAELEEILDRADEGPPVQVMPDGSCVADDYRPSVPPVSCLNMVPSEKALHIAARIWCDQDMRNYVMDANAATRIANIIDEEILQKQPTKG